MSNTVARAWLQRGPVRPQTGRVGHDVARVTLPSSALFSTGPICQRCEQRPLLTSTPLRSSPIPLDSVRSLHTSLALSKSKKKEEPPKRNNAGHGKSKESSSSSMAADEDGPKHPQPSPEEPLNFADAESRLGKLAEHFRPALKKMHTGSRFDPDVLGALRVTVDKKKSGGGEAYPLRELAQVVPRGGRAVSLLVHEAGYVKPIMSAVQGSSQFNQQPQRDPDNELELTLKVEPESREDLAKRVKAVAHEWRERVRAVRQKRDKLHVAWRKEGVLGPDLKRTADKELDKVIKAAIAEVDALEKSTLKASE
ncbi:ribosome recycling factor [Xylaria sp. FL1042]|nr:ribosome recycling factor [Xylaria sp. FL1042]